MEELFSMTNDLENVPWSTTIGHDDRSSVLGGRIGWIVSKWSSQYDTHNVMWIIEK